MKVTDMNTASSVGNGDLLMVVQGGENKKLPADYYLPSDGQAVDSAKLGGTLASEYIKAGDTASNASKLGGVDASDYATKEYVNARTGGADDDPTWCCPKMWFSDKYLPNNDTEHWAFCDGKVLNKNSYPDLFAVIGYTFTTDSNGEPVSSGDNFKLPNLKGRFVLGANVNNAESGSEYEGEAGEAITTQNLPNGIYSGDDFTSAGQFKMPTKVGKEGGDPTAVQVSPYQIAKHKHQYYLYRQATEGHIWMDDDVSDNPGIPRLKYPADTPDTGVAGYNSAEQGENGNFSQYPIFGNYDANTNYAYGMLAMPPYVTFAWIMRIKK